MITGSEDDLYCQNKLTVIVCVYKSSVDSSHFTL